MQPKQFDVLVYLMLNAGRVVGEDELLDTFWPDTTRSKDDSLVRSAISRVRTALGLTGDSFIQTAPRGWGIGIWSLRSETRK